MLESQTAHLFVLTYSWPIAIETYNHFKSKPRAPTASDFLSSRCSESSLFVVYHIASSTKIKIVFIFLCVSTSMHSLNQREYSKTKGRPTQGAAGEKFVWINAPDVYCPLIRDESWFLSERNPKPYVNCIEIMQIFHSRYLYYASRRSVVFLAEGYVLTFWYIGIWKAGPSVRTRLFIMEDHPKVHNPKAPPLNLG